MEIQKKEFAVCNECGSLFFKGSSQMMALCPECAHILYFSMVIQTAPIISRMDDVFTVIGMVLKVIISSIRKKIESKDTGEEGGDTRYVN